MNDKYKIIALGGLGENGKNTYLIESKDTIIVIDAGLSNFANKALGIDFVLPNYDYLVQNKKKVKGILVSHGHLDQMGGISHILNLFDVNIYGSNYTVSFLKTYIDKSKHRLLKEVKYNDVLKLGSMTIECFSLSHAVFGNYGFVIDIKGEAIVYATDYNFDQTSSKFSRTDITKIVSLKNKYNIKVLMTESISVNNPGSAGSLKNHLQKLRRYIETSNGRKIISLYSSNLAGMRNIIDLAGEYNKKIVIVGRDLLTYINIAKDFNYIYPKKKIFARVNEINKIKDEDLIIVVAGLYADPFVEINKMAQGKHNILQIKHTDEVLIASKPYDETEALAQKVLDSISLTGAKILIEKINVSSHAHEEDVKMMINLFEPTFIVPIKGEYRKFIRLQEIAYELGYNEEQFRILKNGDVLSFVENGCLISETLKNKNQLISLDDSESTNPIILKDREVLSDNGYVLVVIPIDKKTGEIVQEPEIQSGGLISFDDDQDIIEGCKKIVKKELEKDYNNKEFINKLKNKMGKYLQKNIGKIPLILPLKVFVEKK
ncbi:MAG: ribonuclease J [Mycoplasmatales bacterium]